MKSLPTPADLAALAERMTGELRAQGVVGNVAYDRDNQRLLNEGMDSIPIDALILPYQGAQEDERGDLVRRYIAACLRGRQTIETWEEARGRVLPKIQPEVEIACWPLRSKLEGGNLPAVPTGQISEHLRVQFVWQVEDGVATVHAADVERWGVSLDDIQDAGAENLSRRTPTGSEWLGSPDSPGVFRSKWRDGFDATRVLLAGDFSIPAKGPLVAIATSDSDLFLADSADDTALFQLGLAVQRQMKKNPGMVWLWPLLLDGEKYRHWLPDESSAAFAPLSTCAAMHAQAVYNLHGKLLQRVLEFEGSPVHVGEVGMVQTPLGAAAAVAVWSDGAPAAVAHADFIQFRRDGEVLGVAPWAEVERVMGDLLEEVPGYPARYRGHVFPEPWQLAQLGIDEPS